MKFDRRIIAACLAGLLCSSSAVLADDAAPAAAGAAKAPAAAPASPAPVAQVPDAVKAWGKFCDPAPDGHKICIVRKLVFQGTNIMASLTFRIDSAKDVPVLAIAAVPVGVVLKPGLLWQIDKQKATALPYWRCTPQTCESEQLVKPDYIAKLKKANTLTLVAKNVQNQNFAIDVPLDGFGAVFDQQDAPTFAEYSQKLAAAQQSQQAQPAK